MAISAARTDADPVEVIEALERRRYAAMLATDIETLTDLLDEQLVYTHSFGERDNKQTYLDKVARGVFKYHELSHTSERIIVGQDAAVIAGRMKARASVGTEIRDIDNSCMAVWMRTEGVWRLVAYQPTPFRR